MPHLIPCTVDELRLAWRRVALDRANRTFVTHPELLDWVNSDLDAWLERLRVALSEQGYAPHAGRLCLAPKSPDLLRPGTILEIEDEVIFNLLVGRLLPLISGAVLPLQGDPDIANQLQLDSTIPQWVLRGVDIWKQWREKSLEKLDSDVAFVVFADITGFYDNIDLDRLGSDLRRIGAPEPETNLLRECLQKWSLPRNKGVPQGYSASDILAKLYLTSIDLSLRNDELIHLRYVDDIRLFCASRLAARLALRRLTQLLHFRGLTLQSAKTRIKPKQEAQSGIDGVTPLIETIQHQLLAELEDEFGDTGPYMTPSDIAHLLSTSEGPSVAVLERAFQDSFTFGETSHFDSTLFHFLLNRIGNAESREAVGYALDALRSHPEETDHILRYFAKVDLEVGEVTRVAEYLGSTEAIHDYQRFQILRWFYEREIKHNAVLRRARLWYSDLNREPWLRSFAIAYLGRFGDASDLEAIEQWFANVTSDLEKAECVSALRRAERTRRNSFYARVKDEGFLVEAATRAVKSQDRGKARKGSR